MPVYLVSRVEKSLPNLNPKKMLLLGTDGEELLTIQQIIEENFDCETEIAKTELEAKKIPFNNNAGNCGQIIFTGAKCLFVTANNFLDWRKNCISQRNILECVTQ